MTTEKTLGPRDRLLDAAQTLTYQQGVNVGIDAILKSANVARRSLYEHFGGKDGLLVEVLKRSTAEDEARYREIMLAAGDDPRARLLAVFDSLGAIIADPGFRGCRYLAADLALADPRHPVHAVTREYRQSVQALFEQELVRLGHPRPGRAAEQLFLLVNGVLASGGSRSGAAPAAVAKEMAAHVLG